MAIDSVFVLQDEMSQAEAEKFMGWAMWRRGAQAQLPASHPYRNAPPQSSGAASTFVESTPADFDALKAYWQDTAQSEAQKGQVVNTTGWNVVFEDQFDTHTVTDDVPSAASNTAAVSSDAGT